MQRCKSVDLKLNHKKRDLYDYYFFVTKSGQALLFVVITELFTFVGISGYFGTTSPKLKVFITKAFIRVRTNISMVLYTLEEIYDDFCFTNTMNKMGNTEVTVRLFSGNESFITTLFILCNKN